MTRVLLLLSFGWLCAGSPLVSLAEAMTVTQLELTGGAVNWGGRHERMLDRLLSQDGALVIGQYQAMGEIVPSIAKGHRTFSIVTSGLSGAAAPALTIAGSSITVDLSSLYFGRSRGGEHRLSPIGGLATGLYNPETREFSLSWQHLLSRHWHERRATFFLKGVVVDGPQAVAIPAGLVLYATGLPGLGSWTWWLRRAGSAQSARAQVN